MSYLAKGNIALRKVLDGMDGNEVEPFHWLNSELVRDLLTALNGFQQAIVPPSQRTGQQSQAESKNKTKKQARAAN